MEFGMLDIICDRNTNNPIEETILDAREKKPSKRTSHSKRESVVRRVSTEAWTKAKSDWRCVPTVKSHEATKESDNRDKRDGISEFKSSLNFSEGDQEKDSIGLIPALSQQVMYH